MAITAGAVELGTAILGSVGLLVQGGVSARRWWIGRVVVKRISNAQHPDLDPALDLYEDRLAENVRDSREDIAAEGQTRAGRT
jgi:hypothetical protein